MTKSRRDNNEMVIKDTGKDVSVKGKWGPSDQYNQMKERNGGGVIYPPW